jgi:hypothetical protein
MTDFLQDLEGTKVFGNKLGIDALFHRFNPRQPLDPLFGFGTCQTYKTPLFAHRFVGGKPN